MVPRDAVRLAILQGLYGKSIDALFCQTHQTIHHRSHSLGLPKCVDLPAQSPRVHMPPSHNQTFAQNLQVRRRHGIFVPVHMVPIQQNKPAYPCGDVNRADQVRSVAVNSVFILPAPLLSVTTV